MNIHSIEESALRGIAEAFERELRDVLEEKLDSFLQEIRAEYMEEIEKTVDHVSKRVDLAFYRDMTSPMGQPFLKWLLNDTERTKKHDGYPIYPS